MAEAGSADAAAASVSSFAKEMQAAVTKTKPTRIA